jgi:Fe-S-cluster containining protein
MPDPSQDRTPRRGGRRRGAKAHCDDCDALCCRLTVVVFEEDAIPAELTERTAQGVQVMARGGDGRCVALDAATSRCGIYANRPTQCRRFAMAGPYCLSVRALERDTARALSITLL